MAGAENTKCRSVRFGEIVAVAKNVRTQIYTKIQTAKIEDSTHKYTQKYKITKNVYCTYTNIHKNTNCKDSTHKYTQKYKITKNVYCTYTNIHKNTKLQR